MSNPKIKTLGQGLSRRHFIQGTGGAILGLPLLESLVAQKASAQTKSHPKRLVIFYATQGLLVNEFIPTGTPSNYSFQGEFIRQVKQHKDKILVLTGLDNQSAHDERGNDHSASAGHALTGAKMKPGATENDYTRTGGPSIDFRIAQGIKSPAPLHLTNRLFKEICYTGPGEPVNRERDPLKLYDSLFANAPKDTGQANKRRARRQSVLSATKAQINAIQGSISASDRVRLDGYLSRVEEIEKRVTQLSNTGCVVPNRPELSPSPERLAAGWGLKVQRFHPDYDIDVSTDALMDLMVLALACNKTQVATFYYGQQNRYHYLLDRNGHYIGYRIAPDGGYERDEDGHRVFGAWHGDFIHRLDQTPTTQADYSALYDAVLRVKRYEWQQFNKLLTRLDSVPEGNGTLLDNTLVLYANEFGERTHGHKNMPYLIAGSCGGAIKTGRWLKFNGEPHNRLFLSMLRAFDLHDATFGDPVYCTGGPLPGIVS